MKTIELDRPEDYSFCEYEADGEQDWSVILDDIREHHKDTSKYSIIQDYKLRYSSWQSHGRSRKREKRKQPETRGIFSLLADRWHNETFGVSCIEDLIGHPDYQSIINLGMDVVPFLLQDLKEHPVRWLYALEQIVGEDPSGNADEIDEVAAKWMEWGMEKGYL